MAGGGLGAPSCAPPAGGVLGEDEGAGHPNRKDLEWEREAVQAELMGLHLWYSTLQRSVEMLCNYQEDMTQALEWQEENNVQE
ncbi:hypothetical protein C0993_000177, partial [Termitomyces sp. T159_Od127]